MITYRKRIADALLAKKLRTMGAVLIECLKMLSEDELLVRTQGFDRGVIIPRNSLKAASGLPKRPKSF